MEEETLSPPKRTGTIDPGAHDLAQASDSDDHFSDAQSAPMSPSPSRSPVPITRVEKVEDSPSYGEVPGTEAYRKRQEDAEPDEIAIIPDPEAPAPTERGPSPSPGGHPIPKTVVEESEGAEPHHYSAEFERKRQADAPPDLVLKADGGAEGADAAGTTVSDVPLSPALMSPRSDRGRRRPSKSVNSLSPGPESTGFSSSAAAADADADNKDEDEDDFGDDFDDFEEGDQDADFDDFEEGFQEPEVKPAPAPAPPPPAVQQPAALPYPVPDFDGLDSDDINGVLEPYLNALFPPEELDAPTLPPLSKDNPIFLTPRSASLWSQLVAPPPLAPPDWIRSRIRRLFLVSLGVPVDLDEILPASKQKKLVLPSLHGVASPRTSTDSRSPLGRLKQGDANASSTSVDSQGRPSSRRRKGPPPVPDLDLVAARQLCMTTDAALDGMTDAELRQHVARLEAMEGTAKEMLEQWQKRTDEKIGDREAFEGVIENLVKHARKVRK